MRLSVLHLMLLCAGATAGPVFADAGDCREVRWKIGAPPWGYEASGRVCAGRREGAWQFRFLSGEPMREGEYRQGAEHGPWTSFYRGGGKQQEVHYVDGRPEGSVRRWHPNGRLMLEGNYEAGARAGTWRRWFASGARYEERSYADGMRDGRFLRWDGQGRLALVLACAKDRCREQCQAAAGAACSLDETPSASGAKATPEPAAARRPPRTKAR